MWYGVYLFIVQTARWAAIFAALETIVWLVVRWMRETKLQQLVATGRGSQVRMALIREEAASRKATFKALEAMACTCLLVGLILV